MPKIGQNYRKAGEIEMAIESFAAVLQVEPEHRATRLALSEAYRSIGRVEKALQILPSEMEIPAGKPDEEFINWTGLDELFGKIIGVGIERFTEDGITSDIPEESDSDSSDAETRNKLRFGPERTRRSGKGQEEASCHDNEQFKSSLHCADARK